jgi:hypothetical protein
VKRALAMFAVVAALGVVAVADSDDKTAAAKRAFGDVYRVLESPRCMNCHPSGDRPLQGDDHHPHAQNISRKTVAAGVPCTTCHQARNSEAVGVVAGPPGAPNWALPPADMPMVFQGKTPSELCAQLKDPAQNHARSLAQLLEHATSDPIVLWGWQPGGNRTVPPLSHDAFVAAFTTWVAGDGACP